VLFQEKRRKKKASTSTSVSAEPEKEERERGIPYNVEFVAAIKYRHVSAPANVGAVGKELVHELVQAEAALLEHTRLAILRKNDVLRRQRRCGSDGDAFFASRRLPKRKTNKQILDEPLKGIFRLHRSSQGR
jgi:hypothetical protein